MVPWYGVEKYYLPILAYLQSTIPSVNDEKIFKTEQKALFKAAQIFKKIKYFNDLVTIEVIKITTLKNQWLIKQTKANANIKTRI